MWKRGSWTTPGRARGGHRAAPRPVAGDAARAALRGPRHDGRRRALDRGPAAAGVSRSSRARSATPSAAVERAQRERRTIASRLCVITIDDTRLATTPIARVIAKPLIWA